MKITDVTVFTIHPGWRKNLLLVKLETDGGITGWGEAYTQYDRDRAVRCHLEEIGRYLIDRDPFQIRHLRRIAFDDYAQRRGSLEFYSSFSAVETAMWDIVGKATGQPVYNLLGGPCRKKIRVYANGWSYKLRDIEDFLKAAEKTVEAGYTALKFDPLPRPWRTHVPLAHLKHAEGVVRALRKRLGPDIDLLLDIHRRLAPMHAIELAKRIEEYEPYWFEEPCQAEHLEAIAEVRQHTRIPVVTGENILTKAGFRPVFDYRAADIINPDVANTGGILELLEIAAMAEPYMVAVSPHNYNSTTLALSATVHASACMPNFIITEYFLPFVELGDTICRNQLKPVDGYITLPEEPGLGIEVNEEVLADYAYQQFPLRKLPFPEDDGVSAGF